MQSTINNRIQEIVDKLFNGNKAAFAKAINKAPTTISNILSSRKTVPSADIITSIINSIENLNSYWLITGIGDMISSPTDIKQTNTPPISSSEIIQKIIENEDTNPNALSIAMGLKKVQPIYDIINGKIKKISSDYANRIMAAFPHYNIEWLLSGEGNMLKSSNDNIINSKKEIIIHLQSPAKLIPHIIEGCADCGKPNGFDIAIKEDQCPKYIIPGLTGCDFTIPARGRSMINKRIPEKSIHDGDIIGCRKWNSRSHIRWGEVYVLSTTEGITVKQIEPSEREGYIKCVPFNTEEGFLPFEIPVNEIYDWAIVVGIVSVSMWS